MIALIEILRPVNGLMAVLAFVIGAILCGLPIAPIPLQLLIGAIVVFLHSGAGMVLNDYFDWKIDRVNRPYRIIPSGRMSLEAALNYATALFGVGLALAFFFLPPSMIILAVFNAALSILYSWKMKRTAIGHIIVSWLTASVFIFASLLVETITEIALILFSLVFCANLAREIVKGIEDYRGDKALGARTLAIVLGKDVAGWLGITFAFLALAIAPLPYVLGYLKAGYAATIALAAAILAYSCYLIIANKPDKAQLAIKWSMGIALFALIAGLLV